MQTRLIAIGNSKGVRLPKAILDQAGLTGPIRLSVTKHGVLLSPVPAEVRAGWSEAARALASSDEDNAEWNELPVSTDDEWTW